LEIDPRDVRHTTSQVALINHKSIGEQNASSRSAGGKKNLPTSTSYPANDVLKKRFGNWSCDSKWGPSMSSGQTHYQNCRFSCRGVARQPGKLNFHDPKWPASGRVTIFFQIGFKSWKVIDNPRSP